MGVFKKGTYVNSTRSGNKNVRAMRYIRICCGPQRDRYMHQLVAEAMLGRPLRENEVVDHYDDDPFNNHPSNLVVCTVKGNTNKRRKKKRELLEIIFDGHEQWGKPEGFHGV